MNEVLPVRISGEGRVATWNPALTRARQVWIEVMRPDGTAEPRRTLNSGRARVREGERIVAVRAAEE